MKKEDAFSIVAYILMIAVALLVGIFVIRDQLQALSSVMDGGQWGIAIGGIAGSFVLNVVLFEVAHIVGAKMGGYRITKVNLFYLNIHRKQDDKWGVNFRSFDGITGEVKIAPKQDAKTDPNPRPYLWAGTLLYIVQLIAGIILIILFADNEKELLWLSTLATIHITLGGMLLLYNIFPAKLDSKNDGYFIRVLTTKTIIRAFNQLLYVEDEVRRGLPAPKMDVVDEINEFTTQLNMLTAIESELQLQYDEAITALDTTLYSEKGHPGARDSIYLLLEKIVVLILANRIEEARKIYEEMKPEEKRIAGQDHSFSGIRRYFLISALLDDSFAESLGAYRNYIKLTTKHSDILSTTEGLLFQRQIGLLKEIKPEYDYVAANQVQK